MRLEHHHARAVVPLRRVRRDHTGPGAARSQGPSQRLGMGAVGGTTTSEHFTAVVTVGGWDYSPIARSATGGRRGVEPATPRSDLVKPDVAFAQRKANPAPVRTRLGGRSIPANSR